MTDSKNAERWLRHFGKILTRDPDGGLAGPKEFLGALASWAGKGRDELLHMICKEIGQATASVLQEPLHELMKTKKLQITIELLAIEDEPAEPPAAKSKPKGRRKVDPED
jgi:hypothetical protein